MELIFDILGHKATHIIICVFVFCVFSYLTPTPHNEHTRLIHRLDSLITVAFTTMVYLMIRI